MEIIGQARLGLPPLATINVTANYFYPDGWTVRVSHRHEGDRAHRAESYTHLTSAEAQDALEAALGALWGGACSCTA